MPWTGIKVFPLNDTPSYEYFCTMTHIPMAAGLYVQLARNFYQHSKLCTERSVSKGTLEKQSPFVFSEGAIHRVTLRGLKPCVQDTAVPLPCHHEPGSPPTFEERVWGAHETAHLNFCFPVERYQDTAHPCEGIHNCITNIHINSRWPILPTWQGPKKRPKNRGD